MDNAQKTARNWRKIEQVAAGILLFLIVAGCFIVLSPFVTSILWAGILCFSTWPIYLRMESWLGGRKALSAFTMTLIIALVLLVPFAIATYSFADDVVSLARRLSEFKHDGVPAPPEWIKKIPLAGNYLANYWGELAQNTDQAAATLTKWLNRSLPVILKWSITLGEGIIQLALSILIAFFFYRDGPQVVERVSAGIKQIAGDYGLTILKTTGDTVKSVVYGLLGTALIQAIAAGIGYTLAGVPGALVWAMLTFFFALVPFGPPLIWGPTIIWLFLEDHPIKGMLMLAYGVFVISGIDNLARPILISKGTSLPFILILMGVLGGLAAWGFLGLFLGPTLLAVGFCLIQSFIGRGTRQRAEPAKPEAGSAT